VKRETLVVSLLVESLEHHSVAIRVIRFTSVNVFHYSIPGREASSTPVSMRGRGSTLAGVHPLKGAYALHDATHGSGRDSKRGSEFTDQDVDSRFYPRETSYPSNPYHDRSGSWGNNRPRSSFSQDRAGPDYFRYGQEQGTRAELEPQGFGWQFREGQHRYLGEREVTGYPGDFEFANRPGGYHRQEMSGYSHSRYVDPVTHTRPTQDAVVHARTTSDSPIDRG
jgi:hypothetical protein